MHSRDNVDEFDVPSSGSFGDDEITAQLFRSAFAGQAGPKSVTRRWREMTTEQSQEAWRSLSAWVRWLVATYQLTTSVVPDCWWRHPEIVAELYALHRAELASYTTDDPGFGPLAFHERLPHAVERLRTHTRAAGCVGLQAHKEPAPRMLANDDPAFLDWCKAAHQLVPEF
ncbi:hypothetical protein [Pseudarthrobacter niigatensis]|uniref:DUF4913 domain-containing protein n=1 Tax=Pseudarthrobacter niigatensis TaxID=369935 RepID=A0AAJ1SPY1_9MICC|nr:hypothetical protein [Pseudarthrobacter niigatensis]MDQ0144699.1 hypothetical protein [Pseudarthrobacter niigatensis]MDQ0265345.1 hypothetical protein [Pseudarthrobacter niigatensis]